MDSYFVQQWVSFLQTSDPLLGIPLCGAGAALVLGGWRLWRLAAIVSLLVVGAAVGQLLSGDSGLSPAWAGGGAAVLGLAGVLLPALSATVLGGAIGGAVIAELLGNLGVVGPLAWVGMGLACVGAGGWSYANRQRITIVITSLEGAALLVSGLAVMITEWPMMYGFLHSMVVRSWFIVPFFLLVPTVVGVTLQLADVARSYAREIRA